jgi:hypothetical protein
MRGSQRAVDKRSDGVHQRRGGSTRRRGKARNKGRSLPGEAVADGTAGANGRPGESTDLTCDFAAGTAKATLEDTIAITDAVLAAFGEARSRS